MKKALSFVVAALFLVVSIASVAFAGDVYVNGYHRKDGTYVQPHYRTAPDSTRNNNYSTLGNQNPYTGQMGTRPRDEGSSAFGIGGNSNSSNCTSIYCN